MTVFCKNQQDTTASVLSKSDLCFLIRRKKVRANSRDAVAKQIYFVEVCAIFWEDSTSHDDIQYWILKNKVFVSE